MNHVIKKTPIITRIEDASSLIVNAPPSLKEVAYNPRELVQATLPHRNPGDTVPAWERRNGNYTLGIQPGWDFNRKKSCGYPYGSIPRLLIFWLTAEAVRTGNRNIKMGDSLADFMRELGLDPDRRGQRSDYNRLIEQWRRLFNAKISFQYSGEINGKHYESLINLSAADKFTFWTERNNRQLPIDHGSYVELTENFFKAITSNPIPLDLRALQAVKNSSFALDVYSWATLRTYAAQQKDKPQFISWGILESQFGADYGSMYEFRRHFKIVVEKVKNVYPWFDYAFDTKGITIKPSVPSVRKSLKKLNMPAHENTDNSAKIADTSKKIQISSKAFESAVYTIVNAGTGWCKYELERQFYEYARSKGERIRNVDKAFLGFVSKKVLKLP